MINKENIIMQQLVSVSFITELFQNQLLDSQFYKNMNFSNESVKEYIEVLGINNQGMLTIFLYCLLNTPYKLLYEDYTDEFEKLNEIIENIKISFQSNFEEYAPDYLFHISNAISNATIDFTQYSLKFNDKFNENEFSVEIPLCSFGVLLSSLQIIIYKYIEDKKVKS